MKTVKELQQECILDNLNCNTYIDGYRKALKEMLKDIQNSEATSVRIIEKWLEDLINK